MADYALLICIAAIGACFGLVWAYDEYWYRYELPREILKRGMKRK